MTGLTRRELLVNASAAGAGLALAGCESQDPYALPKPAVPLDRAWGPLQERPIATICAQCPAGCGVRVRVVEGRAVKLEGNTDHPVNRGGLGPKGQSGLGVLYDPDRVRGPLRLKGERGSGEWEAVGWDEALAQVGAALAELRRGGAHRLVVVSGALRGPTADLWRRFAQAYGTPNLSDPAGTALAPLLAAARSVLGLDDLVAYDLAGAQYVLSLDAGLLETTCQGIHFARQAAALRTGTPGRRVKIVHASPSYTTTALHADEWLPIRPGTQALLALGLAHVLVAEGLHDAAFLEAHATGFEAAGVDHGTGPAGLRDLILRHTPAQVAEATGLGVRAIERLAGEMAAHRPAVVVVDERSTAYSNGRSTALAALALNAVLGSVGRPGGAMAQERAPLAPWPEVAPDETARSGLAQPRLDGAGTRFREAPSAVEALADAVLSGAPYAPGAVLVYHANPAFARAAPQRFREALARVPLVVSFSPFADDTARLADWILPDSTYLERWEYVEGAPSVGYPVVGIRQPAVAPLHDTRPTGEVVLALARALGEGVSGAFPWADFRAAQDERLKGLWQAQTGSIVEKSWKDFRKRLLEAGHWEAPPCRYAAAAGGGRVDLAALAAGIEAAGGLEPRWQGDPERYPLQLVPYRAVTYAEGSGANLPVLQELGDVLQGHRWRSCAELHPATARSLDLVAGQRVRLSSPAGQVELCLTLWEGVPPGTVAVALGGGHRGLGRWADGRGANVREVLVPDLDAATGWTPLCATRVRLEAV